MNAILLLAKNLLVLALESAVVEWVKKKIKKVKK